MANWVPTKGFSRPNPEAAMLSAPLGVSGLGWSVWTGLECLDWAGLSKRHNCLTKQLVECATLWGEREQVHVQKLLCTRLSSECDCMSVRLLMHNTGTVSQAS